jgi:hypothetical protein
LSGVLYAGQGVKFTGGTIASATTVLHTNNVVYSRGGSSGMFLQNSDGSDGIFIANDYVRFDAGSTERMRINSAGNVGIGVTSPSAKLDVNGTGTFRGNLDIYKSNAKFTVASTGASEQAGVDVKNGSLHARWILDSDDLLRVYNQTSAFDAFAVKSSGNVGIGTTNPTHKLTVNAPNNTTAVGIDFPSAHFDFSANSTSGYTTSFHMDDTATTIGSNSAGRALKFQTNNTDRLYINGNTGNVGIGTTSPDSKLEVDMNDASGNRLGFIGDGSTTGSALWTNWTTGASYLDFRLGGITDTYTKMRITHSGNVGIGTTSPNSKLNIRWC